MVVILSIFFWIILSIAVGKYWKIKGRNFGGGVFLSILLSPAVGFAIGFLLVPLNRKKCPDCASEVPIEAKVCKWCGHKFMEITRQGEKKLDEKDELKSVAPNIKVRVRYDVILGQMHRFRNEVLKKMVAAGMDKSVASDILERLPYTLKRVPGEKVKEYYDKLSEFIDIKIVESKNNS